LLIHFLDPVRAVNWCPLELFLCDQRHLRTVEISALFLYQKPLQEPFILPSVGRHQQSCEKKGGRSARMEEQTEACKGGWNASLARKGLTHSYYFRHT